MNRRHWQGALASVLLAACFLPNLPDAVAQEVAASADEIEVWIRQLDSNEFIRRKVATQNLIKAGRPAIAPPSVRVDRIAKSMSRSFSEMSAKLLSPIASSSHPYLDGERSGQAGGPAPGGLPMMQECHF